MPTLPDTSTGMGLEELLLYQNQPDLFKSLTTPVCEVIDASFNPNLDGGIATLLKQAEEAPLTGENQITLAIADHIQSLVDLVTSTIQADLDAQQAARAAASSSSLVDSIVPEAGQELSPLIDLVATDTFREIIG